MDYVIVKLNDDEKYLLDRIAIALEKIAAGVDKSNLETRMEELESYAFRILLSRVYKI